MEVAMGFQLFSNARFVEWPPQKKGYLANILKFQGNDGMTTCLHIIRFLALLVVQPDRHTFEHSEQRLYHGKTKQTSEQREPNPVDIPLYWLVNRDSYNGLLQSPYNWQITRVLVTAHQTFQSIQVTFLHLLWWSALPAEMEMLRCTGKPRNFWESSALDVWYTNEHMRSVYI